MENFLKKILLAVFAIPLALCLSAFLLVHFGGLDNSPELTKNNNFEQNDESSTTIAVEEGIPKASPTLTKVSYEPMLHPKRRAIHILELGAEISAAQKRGISAEEIANAADLELKDLEGIEDGLATPTKEIAEAIAHKLHLDVYYKLPKK
jgi:hypothetical protein